MLSVVENYSDTHVPREDQVTLQSQAAGQKEPLVGNRKSKLVPGSAEVSGDKYIDNRVPADGSNNEKEEFDVSEKVTDEAEKRQEVKKQKLDKKGVTTQKFANSVNMDEGEGTWKSSVLKRRGESEDNNVTNEVKRRKTSAEADVHPEHEEEIQSCSHDEIKKTNKSMSENNENVDGDSESVGKATETGRTKVASERQAHSTRKRKLNEEAEKADPTAVR